MQPTASSVALLIFQSALVLNQWIGPMKCLRIYADETGESHLADLDIPLVPTEVFPGIPALDLSDQYTATSVRFARVPAGMRVADWHTTPVRQLVIWLTGWVEFETSDGDTRRCNP